MEWEECITTTPSSYVVKKCIRRATRFRPCLCEYTSKEDAIIDMYIMNTSKRAFVLTNAENIVTTGAFADQQPGLWIIEPPRSLQPNETVFSRAYSGKISTTVPDICTYAVNFTITIAYEDKSSADPRYVESYDSECEITPPFFRFEVGTSRNSEGDGCTGLQPFDPVSITDFTSKFPVVNIYNLTPQRGIDVVPQNEQDVVAQNGDVRWKNTVFFIIS